MDAPDLAAHLAALPPVEVLYTDLDGTLLGPGGSLLTAPDGTPSTAAAQALVDAAAACLTVVCVSGRAWRQLANDARILGLSGCIAEAGSVIVRAGTARYEWGEAPRSIADTPHAALERSGAVALLLERFADDLRPYEPWHRGREGGHLLHGRVDAGEADALLAAGGFGWAHLVDNGAASGWEGREVRAYHLIPRGVGKAQAVADDLAERGLTPADALAVGDSEADAAMSSTVGTYLQVANGHAAMGGNRFALGGAMGHGFAQAVAAALSARDR